MMVSIRPFLGALFASAPRYRPFVNSWSIRLRKARYRLKPLLLMEISSAIAYTWEDKKHVACSKCILPLTEQSHKGSSGRIAVIGGSERFYAATAALRTGVDLCTVYCAEEASTPIKSYSPELMVQPVYTAKTISLLQGGSEVEAMVQAVEEGMDQIHCILVGPGLGRSPPVLDAVHQIIKIAVAKKKYLVLDADALFMLSMYKDILQGYDRVVMTPNVAELQRMKNSGSLEFIRDATIVQKGRHDLVTRDGSEIIQCIEPGGLKRPGGIGDVLAGTIAALVSWHAIQGGDLALSCWTACCIVKRATANAYSRKQRAMSAQDVIDDIGSVFHDMVN